jgi:hypothetical protein
MRALSAWSTTSRSPPTRVSSACMPRQQPSYRVKSSRRQLPSLAPPTGSTTTLATTSMAPWRARGRGVVCFVELASSIATYAARIAPRLDARPRRSSPCCPLSSGGDNKNKNKNYELFFFEHVLSATCAHHHIIFVENNLSQSIRSTKREHARHATCARAYNNNNNNNITSLQLSFISIHT